MSTLKRRDTARASLFDWLEGEFPPMPFFRAFDDTHPVRVEEYVEDGQYVLRAELPGMDPDKDIHVVIEHGMLTVRAERREEKEEKKDGRRSEFRYGSFTRSVALPTGADEEAVTATYTAGILEVRVDIPAASEPHAKTIPVTKK